MKRYFIRIVFVMMIGMTCSACSADSFLDFFTLKSVRTVTGKGEDADVEELMQKAKGYEKEIARQIEAADKIGDVYEALGVKYLLRKNWDLAVKSFETAVSYGNASDEVHRQLGVAFANRARELGRTEDYRSAVYHYQLAIEKKAENFNAHFGIAMAYFYGLEEKEKGISHVKTAAEGDPELVEARFAYGRMLYEMQRKSEALNVYQSLLEDLDSNSTDYDTYRSDVLKNINTITVELSGNAAQ